MGKPKPKKFKRWQSQAVGPLALLYQCQCSRCRRSKYGWPRNYVGLYARWCPDRKRWLRGWISFECWLHYFQAPIDAAKEKAREARLLPWKPRTVSDAMHVGMRVKRNHADGRARCEGTNADGEPCPAMVRAGEPLCPRCVRMAYAGKVP